jgi:polysaccharide export outer membrane protein
MKTIRLKLFSVVLTILALGSCVTNEKLIYLQSEMLADGTPVRVNDTIESITPSIYRLLPSDNIYVRVVTPDPQWSNMFNTLPTTANMNLTPESAQLLSYPVEIDGTIELPYIGKFHVAGKTLPETKAELETALANYISDAAVTVRLVNNYVSVIGEVQQPGRYPIYKDRMNIFEAIALAGDMGDYGNRSNVQIIRRSLNGNVIKEFSLLDREIMSSDFFYVMPNDVVYTKPRKGQFFNMTTFPYNIILSSITSFILIFNFISNMNE